MGSRVAVPIAIAIACASGVAHAGSDAEVIRANAPELARCYQDVLGGETDAKTRVTVRFQVRPSGHTDDVRATGGTDVFDACVVDRVRGWQFASRTSKVRLTFSIDLAKPAR